MRWFKKRPTPFDDHFSMRTEIPPDSPYYRFMRFTIPDWYYAHLVFMEFYYDSYAMVDPFARHFHFSISRGGILSHRWLCASLRSVNNDYLLIFWTNALYLAQTISSPDVMQHALPPHIYLYPGDVITVEEKPVYHLDRMKDFILTFRIWEL